MSYPIDFIIQRFWKGRLMPVYGIMTSGDPRVCPSLGMAYEVAAR